MARVFELTNAQTAEQCQELVTLIRSVADMQRLILYYGRRAVALRGPAEKVALAAWLVKELDQPADGQAAGSKQEYVLPNDRDNAVRVFYLARSQPAEEYQKAATQIRRATGTGRMYVYNPLGAIAMRGTAEQVAAAERMLKEMQAQ